MSARRYHQPIDWVYFVCFLVVIVLCIVLVYVVQNKDEKIEQYKLKLDQKDSQIYERQLKYEEEKSIADKLAQEFVLSEKELAEYKKRLAQAAERERARSSRASRSRSAGSSRTTQQRTSSSSYGAVHDITMYCPTGNTTASGKWPRRGMVATISRSIPFGTRINIEGLGEFVVEDRIGHGSEYDLFTPSCGEARRFGRKHLRVTILDTD